MSFCARLDRADQMAALLECLLMPQTAGDDAVHVVVDAANLAFHVLGRSKTTRARLTLPAGCFQAYSARDEHDVEFVDGADQEPLAFSVDGGGLVDCLRILGDCDVSVSYAQRDEVVKLTLEEPGAFTACDLCAIDTQDDEDLFQDDLKDAFAASEPACTLLVMSAALRDVVQDLDESAVAAQYIRLSVGNKRARFAARGSTGTVEIDVPRDAFMVFEPPRRRTGWKYRTGAFLHAMKALSHARETCVRISPQGILGVQHLVESDSGDEKIFLEHMVCALEEEVPLDDGPEADDDASDRPASVRASPAF